MRSLKVTRAWQATLIGLSVLASACSGAVVVAPSDDPELLSGQDVYTRNCASCHGSSGAGRRGVRLNDGAVLNSFPDIADQIKLVSEGRGTMPAYGARLSEEDIVAVVRYTREVLNP